MTVTYILSRTIFEIWQNISPIFAVDRGYLCRTHSFGVNPYRFRTTKFVSINWKHHHHAASILISWKFQTLLTSATDGQTDRRTDGRTDIIIANVVRPTTLPEHNRRQSLFCVNSMDNFCLPVHADFIADSDLWRACGYLRSPSPPSSSSAGRDVAASLRSPPMPVADEGRQSSNTCIDAYHNQHQQQRPPSPIDDISNEPMFSFSARAQSNAYKYVFVDCQQLTLSTICHSVSALLYRRSLATIFTLSCLFYAVFLMLIKRIWMNEWLPEAWTLSAFVWL